MRLAVENLSISSRENSCTRRKMRLRRRLEKPAARREAKRPVSTAHSDAPMARRPACPEFKRTRECPRGEACPLNHATPVPCAFYTRGFCRHGPNCHNDHVDEHPQRGICPAYMIGFCPEGPNCRFTHPNFNPAPGDVKHCDICGEIDHTRDTCRRNPNRR